MLPLVEGPSAAAATAAAAPAPAPAPAAASAAAPKRTRGVKVGKQAVGLRWLAVQASSFLELGRAIHRVLGLPHPPIDIPHHLSCIWKDLRRLVALASELRRSRHSTRPKANLRGDYDVLLNLVDAGAAWGRAVARLNTWDLSSDRSAAVLASLKIPAQYAVFPSKRLGTKQHPPGGIWNSMLGVDSRWIGSLADRKADWAAAKRPARRHKRRDPERLREA